MEENGQHFGQKKLTLICLKFTRRTFLRLYRLSHDSTTAYNFNVGN